MNNKQRILSIIICSLTIVSLVFTPDAYARRARRGLFRGGGNGVLRSRTSERRAVRQTARQGRFTVKNQRANQKRQALACRQTRGNLRGTIRRGEFRPLQLWSYSRAQRGKPAIFPRLRAKALTRYGVRSNAGTLIKDETRTARKLSAQFYQSLSPEERRVYQGLLNHAASPDFPKFSSPKLR